MEGILSTENLGFADSFNYSKGRLGRPVNATLEDMVKANGPLGFE